MFHSIVAAEKAAIAGEGHEEFDTQQCRDLQAAFLSVRICSSLAIEAPHTRIALTRI
jgi:hypothetical protein